MINTDVDVKCNTTFKLLDDGSYELKTVISKSSVDEVKKQLKKTPGGHLETSLQQAVILDHVVHYLNDVETFPELLRRTMLILEMIGRVGEPVVQLKCMDMLGKIINKGNSNS